ncbi:MAG: non-heme iron oxygenase ferredoxin subunit [Hydrocarboniphaga sp.]|uniref:Rieske (2Fe-2S) protein n=1 Tax=Hydrocarboniphaga sp. TaxID=2033016 RepID=UPI002617F6B5|nr:non-heme iron oxygenase ferredoxin subunit [Hydrocarboniphaga sp.]MDB5972178.1 non-heme iron oxygenase ferredoxin subunit [Hydrocarboniphaga sp.]
MNPHKLAFTRVLPASELPPNAKKPLSIEGKAILLCNVNGQLHAISNVCSHNDKPLERGRLGNGWIACPTHGARFDLATGNALCLPATKPIATYEVRVVEDWIEVLV